MNMKRSSAILFGALMTFAAGFTATAAERLQLYVGQAKTIPIEGVTRVVLGRADLLSTSLVDGNRLVLLPEAPGDTNMILWVKDANGSVSRVAYDLQVMPSNPQQDIAEIRALIAGIPDVSADIIGGRVVVFGEVAARYAPLITTLSSSYPNAVNATLPKSEFSEKMVELKLKLLEFNSDNLRDLGISWSTSVGGPFFKYGKIFSVNDAAPFELPLPTGLVLPDPPGNDGAQTSARGYRAFGLATDITSLLNFFVSNGDAMLLAEPHLSARSGGEAKFLAGGQVPVVISNGLTGNSVEYKDFGIKLEFKPQVDEKGNVVARMMTEVSSIDPSTSIVGGAPGFRTRSTEADIRLKEGETLVLSGLVTSELGDAVTKVAGLGDLPVLGPLFRSRSFRDRKSELVIFITPRIASISDAAANNTQEVVDEYSTRLRSEIQRSLLR